MRWYGLRLGYERGTAMVTEVGGGQLKRITQIAAITGLFVMGALVSKWTTIKFPLVVSTTTADDGTVTVTTRWDEWKDKEYRTLDVIYRKQLE